MLLNPGEKCLTPTIQVYTQPIPSVQEKVLVYGLGEVLERSLLLLAATSHNPTTEG